MAQIEKFFRQGVNFRHLRLLVALDDYRQIRRVGAYLNVSQPAVSKTLAILEDGLGAKLFQRTKGGMEPTVLGACLVRHARDILTRLNETQNELLDINEKRVGRISLGILPVASVLLVPKLIAQLESKASSVTIKVSEGTMATLLPALRAGDIELAIGIFPHAPLPAEFRSELLIKDPIVAAVRRGHPLVRRERLTWEDLVQFPVILPPASATTRLPIDSNLAAQGFNPAARRVETVSTMVSVGALQFTDSVGFIAMTVAKHFADLGVLAVLPLDLPDLTLRVGMIWMTNERFTEAHWMTQELLRSISQDLTDSTSLTKAHR
jgi:DNA-binding transcriptional LysR family regulator